jgi:hypothetical protein
MGAFAAGADDARVQRARGFDAGAAIEITTVPQAMAQVLAATLTRADLAEVGDKGRALAKARFGWNSVVADLFSTYEWLAGRRDMPPFVRLD